MASERRLQRIERLLDEAEEAVTNEDWPTVASRARSVLAFDPDNADALDLIAGAERGLGGSAPPTSHPQASPPTTAPIATTDQPTTFDTKFTGNGR